MKPKRSLGQNFLNNNEILNDIIKFGNITNEDIILEIGPGTGNLTEKIVKKYPSKLIVVEKDKELSEFLIKKFENKVEVINKDILKCFDNFKYNKPIKVFGNLPYNVSTKILISFIKYIDLENIFSEFYFVFQKEVAERIVAEYNSKQYGRLSILTSWKFNRSKKFDISPKCFFPVPKVWSSLVVLKPKSKIEKILQPKNLEHITNIFFNQRRKMIRKPMKQLFVDYKIVAEKLDLNLNLRPQNLPIKKYFEICKIYESLIK